jgi:superfamily II DNA/RNA helicase
VPAAELHGDLTQSARTQNLASFSSGAVRVMVATDIATRGIHVDGIGLIIHAEPPAGHKAYLHRAGRTARAGAVGVVITLQTPAQGSEVGRLMRRAGVVPHAVTAGPQSPMLRSIAGPPAEPVRPAPRRHGEGQTLAAAHTTGPGAAAVSARSGGHRGRRRR